MRLLHTSDWHLGRSFHGVSLLEEQAAAISRFVALSVEHQVEAVALFNDALSGEPGHRAVLVPHTFVAGGASCESERELTVGNVDRVSLDAFAGFDYVALGHSDRGAGRQPRCD